MPTNRLFPILEKQKASLTENALFSLVRKTLHDVMIAQHAPSNLVIMRRNASTNSGAPTPSPSEGANVEPYIYMSRGDTKIMFAPRIMTGRQVDEKGVLHYVTVHRQQIAVAIDFQATVEYLPASGLRAADLLNLASRCMTLPDFSSVMLANGITMQRVADNALSFSVNEEGQYEPIPTLKAVFMYSVEMRTPIETGIVDKTIIKRI